MNNIKKLTSSILTIIMMLSIMIVPSNAEGTKDLVKYGGYRPYTERYGSTTAGELRLTEIYVYAKVGETLNFGSSVCRAHLGLDNEKMGTNFSTQELEALNTQDIAMLKPSWNKTENSHGYPYYKDESQSSGYVKDEGVVYYDIKEADVTSDALTAQGYIGNVTQEANSSYVPFTYTVQPGEEGIFTFKFYSRSKSAANPVLLQSTNNDAFLADDQKGGVVTSWDLTVKDGTNVKEGRVFTDELFINMGGNAGFHSTSVLNSKIYAVTDDGYQYLIDFNGMDPYGFIFYANNRGVLIKEKDGTTSSLYHSVKSNNNYLSDLYHEDDEGGHGIIINNTPTDPNLDKTYHLFFNQPDQDALTALGIGDPETMDGTVTEFKFQGDGLDGNEGEDKGLVGKGGTFSFEVRDVKETSYAIQLDFGDDNIVTLSNALIKNSVNKIYWNGKDANGKMVGVGEYTANDIKLILKGGEIHFPYLDVEGNHNGIIIKRLNGEGTDLEKATVYYNNSSSKIGKIDLKDDWTIEKNLVTGDKADYSTTGYISDPTLTGSTSTTGASPYWFVHGVGGLGDQALIDFWAYYSKSVDIYENYHFELYNNKTVTVNKVWNHLENDVFPTSIQVDLYENNILIDTQTLSEDNSWSYTWNSLLNDGTYEIREKAIDNYKTTYSSVTSDDELTQTITVTNTYQKPGITVDPNKPATPTNNGGTETTPKTSDESMSPYILVGVGALAIVVAIIVIKKTKD